MPSRPKVQISAEASEDLRDIFQYTLENWGRLQRDRIREKFRSAISDLGTFPLIASEQEARNQLRRRIVKPYVILYRVTDEHVRIVRVIHDRRDVNDLPTD